MKDLKRVSYKSHWNWELGGESVIFGETIPDQPKSQEPILVRITHSNIYYPVDDVEFFVRVGNPDNPTAYDDLDSATDWIKTELVEEIVRIDNEELHRSESKEPYDREQEVPWDGTFETTITFLSGKRSIEIKILSTGYIQSGVISDWVINIK